MRSRLTSLALALSIVSAGDAAAAEELKLAYVNMARALNDVNDGKTAKNRLKKQFQKKQKKLDALQKELKAKKAEFDKKQSMMKAEVRARKQEELQRRMFELQQTYMKLQQELMGDESRVTQEIAGKLRSVIAKIGDRDSYHLVLDIGETVLYYKRHRDITDQVVKEYNRQYSK